MRPLLALAALAAATPAYAEVPLCVPTATVPGFAPGQAPLSDRIGIGRPVALVLRPVGGLHFPVPLTRHQEADSLGGAFPLEISVPGTYHMLLSERAWIDVVRDGAPLVSTEHSHGAPCSGVAKIVAFVLERGHYDLQLSEAAASTMTVKVTREAVIPTK